MLRELADSQVNINGVLKSVANAEYRPGGYTEVEHIESTGTQFIDTGFKPNQNTRVVMDAQFTSTPAALTALFGARGSASSQHFVYYNNNQSKFSLRFGGGTENFVSVTATDRNMFDLNKNTLSVGSKSITATSATFSAARDMYLFAIHDAAENAAGEARYLAAFKLYSCQMTGCNRIQYSFRILTDPSFHIQASFLTYSYHMMRKHS